VKITQNAASSSSSISSSLLSSDSSVEDSIDPLNLDLNYDLPVSSFSHELNHVWNDSLIPDEDDEFCNFIIDAFLA